MRNSYGIPRRSRATRTIKTIIAGTLLAYALFTMLNLGATASAAPEPAAQPEAATVGAGATATEAVPATLPAVEGELILAIALGGLLAVYVVFRRVLAPIARGEFPFGADNPGK